jgi:hypothetical protein
MHPKPHHSLSRNRPPPELRHAPADAFPIACIRCKATLANGDWETIGNDSVTGAQVRVCGQCWRELVEEP